MNLARHWATMARAYLAYSRGKEPSYMPFRIWLEPSSLCQLRCVMCPNSELSKEQKGNMPLDMFREIIDQSKGYVYDVNLTHRGEPLLNPEIVEMVRYAAQAGPKVRLHTNGMTLTREMSRELIKAGLSLLSFSVDGFTKKSYEDIRIGASWDRVLGNIHNFLEEKARLSSKKPYTILQVIEVPGFETEEEQRRDFLARFQGLPVDEIYVKQPSNWAGSYGADIYHDVPKTPCAFPWYALTVCWDGLIVPCPQDFFCRIPLGFVQEGGLAGAWSSKAMRELRSAMAERRFQGLDPCFTCDRLRRPRKIGLPATNISVFMIENLLGYTKWKTRLFGRKDGTVRTR